MAASSILLAWLGQADLNAAGGDPQAASAPSPRRPDSGTARIVLLGDYPEDRTQGYLGWLGARTRAELVVRPVRLSSPMHSRSTPRSTINSTVFDEKLANMLKTLKIPSDDSGARPRDILL